jgi:hypothetical protein
MKATMPSLVAVTADVVLDMSMSMRLMQLTATNVTMTPISGS